MFSDKKRNTSYLPAFTLAEILITLMVLGVIAALTIPALIENYQKRACLEGLKKGLSTVNQVFTRAQVENGPFAAWNEAAVEEGHWKRDTNALIKNYIMPFTNVKEFYPGGSSDAQNENGICYDPNDTPVINTSPNSGQKTPYGWINKVYLSSPINGRTASVALTDGMCIGFTPVNGDYTFEIIIDVNGSKKPPNIAGKDTFFFEINKDGKITPTGYELGYNVVSGTGQGGCSRKQYGVKSGYYCAARIMFDGFQMTKGYPW